MPLLWIIIIILVVLWLFGFFGRNISPRFPRTGNWIHILIVLALILLILHLLGVV
ncbi:MAG: lmo0937 family membrane protein [Anaerolineales bacterium]|nr:lmo0937 family membrane protein [Anaerolineales bacterium]